jgi:hypothetical protein
MTVSDAFRADAWSPESDLHLVLLEISHPDLENSIRVVNDKQSITSGGLEYIAFPFEVSLPESADIGEAIDQAMRLIEAEYDTLKGVLPKNFSIFSKDLLRELLRAAWESADWTHITESGNPGRLPTITGC